VIRVEQEITDDDIVSNNAPDLVAEYDTEEDYAVGAFARVGNYIYISVASPNEGNEPLNSLGVFWTYWGVSNPHSMFDLYQDTITNFTADGIVTITRGIKNTLGIGNFLAQNIKIEYLDELGAVLLTEEYPVLRRYVYDLYDLIYQPFILDGTNYDTVFTPIKKTGVSIRVTFENNGSATKCGYMVMGERIDMGNTLVDVTFQQRKIGNDSLTVANFDTAVEQRMLMPISESAKRAGDRPMMFVIDERSESKFQNLLIIGKILKADPKANNYEKNVISWEIEQNKEL
jgi:hypothetical protein